MNETLPLYGPEYFHVDVTFTIVTVDTEGVLYERGKVVIRIDTVIYVNFMWVRQFDHLTCG